MYSMSERSRLHLTLMKWTGTVLCLIGIALTSFNVYPLNILFGFIGSGMWTLAGVLQKDAPLVLVEAVATVIYFVGLSLYFINVLYSWGIL